MFNHRLCSNHYFFWRRRAIRFEEDKDTALEITAFGDGKSTYQFLAQFKNDYYAMDGLRGLLVESRQWLDVSRFTADQVLTEVARLILAGELGVALRPYSYTTGTSSASVTSNAAPAAAPPLATSKSEEPEPPTFDSSLNGVVQAAALAAAAASGAAFCPH
jgi:hypothetical protein